MSAQYFTPAECITIPKPQTIVISATYKVRGNHCLSLLAPLPLSLIVRCRGESIAIAETWARAEKHVLFLPTEMYKATDCFEVPTGMIVYPRTLLNLDRITNGAQHETILVATIATRREKSRREDARDNEDANCMSGGGILLGQRI